jgi:hypothetical protein
VSKPERIVAGTYFDGTDQMCQDAAKEIRAVLKKHKLAGTFQIASSKHAEFGFEVPEWSAVRFEEMPGNLRALRVKSSRERDGPLHLESSVHLFLSIRDMLLEHTAYLLKVSEALTAVLEKEGIEIEHTPFQQRGD